MLQAARREIRKERGEGGGGGGIGGKMKINRPLIKKVEKLKNKWTVCLALSLPRWHSDIMKRQIGQSKIGMWCLLSSAIKQSYRQFHNATFRMVLRTRVGTMDSDFSHELCQALTLPVIFLEPVLSCVQHDAWGFGGPPPGKFFDFMWPKPQFFKVWHQIFTKRERSKRSICVQIDELASQDAKTFGRKNTVVVIFI